MFLLSESARSIPLNLELPVLCTTQLQRRRSPIPPSAENFSTRLQRSLNGVFAQREDVARATTTIMGVIMAGAGGTATAPLSMLTLVSRRLGAGLHTKVAMEVGLPVAGGRTANGLTTTRLPSVPRVIASPVAVAADFSSTDEVDIGHWKDTEWSNQDLRRSGELLISRNLVD